MSGQHRLKRKLAFGIAAALALLLVSAVLAQTRKEPPVQAPTLSGGNSEFFIHAFHAEKLNGLECSLCHTPVKQGSVELNRPGHEQCESCHADDFEKDLKPKVCAQCHTTFPPTSESDLLPFPRYKNTRAILFQFSHAAHVDTKARNNAATGFRSDCTFCHKFDEQGISAKNPGHTQCAACHAREGMKPQLSASTSAAGCRGCHTPEEIENPNFTQNRRLISPVVESSRYVDIKFSHKAHFEVKEAYGINCTTCHNAVPRSTNLTSLTLPRMLDCVNCHDTSKRIAAEFRMSNCRACHADTAVGLLVPASHNRNIKPDFHTESFRGHHEREAAAPDASCYVCHQNVRPASTGKDRCSGCHQVMMPTSHTARWKDDIHGQVAALDRTTCATCHATDYCSRCHNELPRSHAPLPIFRGGGHAQLAMLDERSCLTCHTFQNTCAECHTGNLSRGAVRK